MPSVYEGEWWEDWSEGKIVKAVIILYDMQDALDGMVRRVESIVIGVV